MKTQFFHPSSIAALVLTFGIGNALASTDGPTAHRLETTTEQPASIARPVIALRAEVGAPSSTAARPECDRSLEARPAGDDPVLRSFERLFTHQPNRVAPPVPAGFAADPLLAAIVQPLRAQGAAGIGMASAGRAAQH